MSNALSSLLAEGDKLVATHREQLPILALEWVKAQTSSGAADIAALMETITPNVYKDVAVLTSYPSGRVSYSLDKGRVALGSITFYVNQNADDLKIEGVVEIRVTRTHYDRQPINTVTHDWLVVALKRSEAINS